MIAQQELEDALAKDQNSEASINVAKAALDATEEQLGVSSADRQRVQALSDYSVVTAPFSGVITKRYADTGSLIQAGTTSNTQAMPVVQLAQSDVLRLRMPVPEEDVPYIQDGGTVEVRVQATGKTFMGKVVRFARALDPSTRTMITEVDVPNPTLELSPGMYAETVIALQQRKNVLTVPIQAVVQGASQSYVLALDANNRVQKKIVTLGVQGPDRVEITSGLTQNETVIVTGQTNYQVGQIVRPQIENVAMPSEAGGPVMSSFAIKYPFFVLMMCLIVIVVGVTTVMGMPVDLFPEVNIPVVVVATFYSGMPPQQIESDITDSYERFFTLGSGIDHIESRSLPGVSLIKIFFQPGVDSNAAVSNISNLAMANLRRLPPGTLPPVVLKFDASNMPVCLITLKGAGLNETQLKDLAQFSVRNQVANVPGASVPQPYGGRYRQIQVYVDPVKLEAHQMSVMDVVKSLNASNLILPAGDVRIGPKDYNIYANSQVPIVDQINDLPLKTVGDSSVMVGDIGQAKDAGQLQTNIVRVDGQKSVYIPVLKQGGNSNTITIVNGVKQAVAHLLDIPKVLKTDVVFDQSVFVKIAVKNVINEGLIGLVLTALMILLFLGNFRATIAVLLSIPISCLATFLVLNMGGNSINTMVLGGLALALSRLIDNSVVVLENIFRHMEMGESPVVAAELGGKEVQLAVLAGTVCTCIVFFPVVLLYGVSKYLFHRVGAGCGDCIVCVVHCSDDCRSFVLRTLHPYR